MTNRRKGLTRTLEPMPPRVRRGLGARGLVAAYRARPPYQRNDYLRWIRSARRDDTRARRLAQMIEELLAGSVYMKMPWRPRR